MHTTRRDFMRYCGSSAVALGLSASDLLRLEEVLANPGAPTALWLQGASCTGCSVSLLNRVSTQRPTTAADLLINSVNLAYHPNLMAASGLQAVAAVEAAYAKGGYVLVIEGGVPTAFGGAPCWAWTNAAGEEKTFAQAVTQLSARAAKIVCVGTCAAFGGIPAAGANPAGVKGVGTYTRKSTINLPGCPAHPDWIVWTLVQLLLGRSISVDEQRRPRTLYARRVHEACPLKETDKASSLGVPGRCLEDLGCRGPETVASCPTQWFNGNTNWCVGAGAPCLGCTQSTFPGSEAFHKHGD